MDASPAGPGGGKVGLSGEGLKALLATYREIAELGREDLDADSGTFDMPVERADVDRHANRTVKSVAGAVTLRLRRAKSTNWLMQRNRLAWHRVNGITFVVDDKGNTIDIHGHVHRALKERRDVLGIDGFLPMEVEAVVRTVVATLKLPSRKDPTFGSSEGVAKAINLMSPLLMRGDRDDFMPSRVAHILLHGAELSGREANQFTSDMRKWCEAMDIPFRPKRIRKDGRLIRGFMGIRSRNKIKHIESAKKYLENL